MLQRVLLLTLVQVLLGGLLPAAHADAAKPATSAPGRCPGPALSIKPLAPGLWQVEADPGDADVHNRGHVSNLFVALNGRRVWLLGSGPSPHFGRRLACQVQALLGRRVTDTISPWPRPELVLGVAGLGPVRHWAHEDVALALRQRCPQCLPRLRARLGSAASDLAGQPVRLPNRHVKGTQGRLGPWRWWRLHRSARQPVTVWQLDGVPWLLAPGLLWGSGVPDGRDADISLLAASARQLAQHPATSAPSQWVGEQGGALPADAATAQARYWVLLAEAVDAALARGDTDSGVPPPIAGLEAASTDPRHALNWQRAYRQAEASLLQRSLR